MTKPNIVILHRQSTIIMSCLLDKRLVPQLLQELSTLTTYQFLPLNFTRGASSYIGNTTRLCCIWINDTWSSTHLIFSINFKGRLFFCFFCQFDSCALVIFCGQSGRLSTLMSHEAGAVPQKRLSVLSCFLVTGFHAELPQNIQTLSIFGHFKPTFM